MTYNLQEILKNIKNSDEHFCKSISFMKNEGRGYFSKSIIDGLRTYLEQLSLYVFANVEDCNIKDEYKDIKETISKIARFKEYKSISKLHCHLKILSSHYSIDEDSSERAMISYYDYLYDIRESINRRFGLNIMHNLEEYPLNQDELYKEYYRSIAEVLNENIYTTAEPGNRFYVLTSRPFFVEGKRCYELVLSNANDYSSKFDRITVFSKTRILTNYAIKARLISKTIKLFEKDIAINILDTWNVSIRTCEIDKLLKITGIIKADKKYSNTIEYKNLMLFLKKEHITLSEIVRLNDKAFNEVIDFLRKDVKEFPISKMLTIIRETIFYNKTYSNTLSYILLKANNNVLKKIISGTPTQNGLYINTKCYPFEKMPFVTSLPSHNPPLEDLIDSLNTDGHEHEIVVRRLISEFTRTNKMFIKNDKEESIEGSVLKYNSQLFEGHKGRRIETYNNCFFQVESDEATKTIIEKLLGYAKSGIKFFPEFLSNFNIKYPVLVDDCEKQTLLSNIFGDTSIAIIYGAAGTGKTTFLSYLVKMFDESSFCVLSVTYTALTNLKERLGNIRSVKYSTIASFIKKSSDVEYDFLIIDECSTVSNVEMSKILNTARYKAIVLVGDLYQIEAIEFGNWFSIIRNFMPLNCVHELTFNHRTTDDNLKLLWNKVRNCDETLVDIIGRKDFSQKPDESLFQKRCEDEVILCLNYNGVYGVNNVNNLCQQTNPQKQFIWDNMTYKIGDPVVFNENPRFQNYVKNNQKGVIVSIKLTEHDITFDIRVPRVLKAIGDASGFSVVDIKDGTTTIRFSVTKVKNYDDDSNDSTIVPFDVAYALTIHKAQGLEFDSVKIIITDDIEERISHNIFYTSITRAKKYLKIYWSPEIQDRVLKRLRYCPKDNDKYLISQKHGFKLNGIK